MTLKHFSQKKNYDQSKQKSSDTLSMELEEYFLLEKLPGSRMRQKILQQIKNPKNRNELARIIGVNWTTINFHLQKLVQANLVQIIHFEKQKYYQVVTRKGSVE